MLIADVKCLTHTYIIRIGSENIFKPTTSMDFAFH